MTKQEIAQRVNLACNFWADSSGLDYISGMTWREILVQDRENQDLSRRFFKHELRPFGY